MRIGLGVVSNTRCNARSYDVRLELHGFRDSAPHTCFMDRGDRPAPCTCTDAVASSRGADASATSLREHRPIRVAEVHR
ncbi:hypothetical protein [Streptomyces sp. NBC_01622]|uniref:hypothetical protein n=1 Tax=Streptomyces sp. NBC_01622 TaxID=2975903 RepID=UPI00386F66EE